MHSTTNQFIKPDELCKPRFIKSSNKRIIKEMFKKYNISGGE